MFHQRTVHRASFHLYDGRPNQRGAASSLHDEGEGPGLLVSPAFWCGGLLSLAAWAALAAALGLI